MNTFVSSCLKTLNLVAGAIAVSSKMKAINIEPEVIKLSKWKVIKPSGFSLNAGIVGYANWAEMKANKATSSI
jgi:hypothetical protein